jgi:hypothetical protein
MPTIIIADAGSRPLIHLGYSINLMKYGETNRGTKLNWLRPDRISRRLTYFSMNIRILFSILFSCLTLGLNAVPDPSENELFSKLEGIRKAREARDYKYIAENAHATMLGSYRRGLLAEIAKQKERFSDKEIEKVLGISIEDLSSLDNGAFYTTLCLALLGKEEELPPVTYVGVVPDKLEDIYYVVTRSELPNDERRKPSVICFIKSDGKFKLWTNYLEKECILQLKKHLLVERILEQQALEQN